MTIKSQTILSRFWRNILAPVDPALCWLWLAAKTKGGYGKVTVRKKQKLAHRLAWLMCGNTDPKEDDLHRSCPNKLCVRPSHHFLLKDNVPQMGSDRKPIP